MQPKLHQSLSDWTFLKAEDWSPSDLHSLFYTFWVSPPSSLRMSTTTDGKDHYGLTNHPLLQDLKAGMIIDNLRWAGWFYHKASMYIGVTGPGSLGIKITPTQFQDHWERWRIRWYQCFDNNNLPKTFLFLDRWIDDHWQAGPLQYYPPMTGFVNRCGIGGSGGTFGGANYHDDTQIYLPN